MTNRKITSLANLATVTNTASVFHIVDLDEADPSLQNKKITFANLQSEIGGGGGDSVKVSANDTTANFLGIKLVAGTDITLTELNDGANETLEVAFSGDVVDPLVFGSTQSVNFSAADSDHGTNIPVDSTITITLPDDGTISKNIEFNVDLDVASEVITYSASGSATISSSSTTQSIQYTTVNCRFNRATNTWFLRGGLT